ncbi:MAG: winged helix-turn-helix domain-containing protein [Tannerella sp.]|jgi:DNA-binding transcriptional regulator YhcF (GntR family)|nr:winged helix-turn-helix domain-containing protein [Tannerella sp.]
MNFLIDKDSKVPYYKQLIDSILQQMKDGNISEGDYLPSMNDLSATLSISKETVKKTYSILREKGIIESVQGKGFYVKQNDIAGKLKILMLFDKLSSYKLVLYRSFVTNIGDNVDITIHTSNQDINLFETLLEENLDKYDYYLITPHFPPDADTQQHVLRLLRKIPNRKLIILDRNIEMLKGNYGSVYQDFEYDGYTGLMQGIEILEKYQTLHIFCSPNSMYGHITQKGIIKFCEKTGKIYQIHTVMREQDIIPGDLYIILNSQLDDEVIDFIQTVRTKHIEIGKEIGIISYNESPINEIIMNGLTVISTDFKEMGCIAAEMIKTRRLRKVKNKFSLIVRTTA